MNMTRRLLTICVAVILSSLAAVYLGAGKADVASAAERGDLAGIRTLITQKADVNAAQADGSTALHWAIYRNDATMTGVLLAAGAKPAVANKEGITPLYLASL